MKVYLLWGEQGEYSDKHSWVHSVYSDAREAARRCSELCVSVARKVDERWYEDEPPTYSVEEKELVTEVGL